MYHSFWYMDTDLFYEHELTQYHKSVADFLMAGCFIYSGIDGRHFCVTWFFLQVPKMNTEVV